MDAKTLKTCVTISFLLLLLAVCFAVYRVFYSPITLPSTVTPSQTPAEGQRTVSTSPTSTPSSSAPPTPEVGSKPVSKFVLMSPEQVRALFKKKQEADSSPASETEPVSKPTTETPTDMIPPTLPKDIKFTRVQVGNKAKMISPKEPQGRFVGVGETIDGFLIKEILRHEVTISRIYSGHEISFTLPRD